MKPNLLFKVLIGSVLLLFGYNYAQAGIIFESATMGPSGQYSGYLIAYSEFLGARFYVSSTVQVTAIGGHLFASYNGDNIFGAIVKLNSAGDLPKGLPFNSSEVVAHTVFVPSYYSSDIRVPLSCTLSPGYYGLVFGSGLYGATGSGGMPYQGQSDLPGVSYFFWLDDEVNYGWYNTSTSKIRFVVEGTTASPGYCSASGGCDEYISNVTVGTINNSSSCGNYQNFTYLSTTMARGTGYPITVTNGNPIYSADLCGIWIDWNQDLDFTDAGETITMTKGSGVGPYTATITPPATASLGSTRMRVRIQYSGSLSPCDTTSFGEVEDYNIIVTAPSTTINISGYVKTAEGVRIKGIRVAASTGPSTVTDALGKYALTLPSPYSGTVGASQTNWTFPGMYLYSGKTTDATDQNFTGTYNVSYAGGSGTSSSPYQISNAAQLNGIGARANDWNKYFVLTADINLSGYDGKAGRPSFNRIGSYINYGVAIMPFTGVFDGAGRTISNFTFDSNGGIDSVGLFGYVDGASAQIKNVKLTSVDVNSTTYTVGTGALAGSLGAGTITGCSVGGGLVHSWNDHVGGLAGRASGTISDCNADVNVSGNFQIGGIVGNSTGTLSHCRSTCNVTGKMECGGLIGEIASTDGKAIRCSSGGNVTINYSSILDRTAGGLIGSNRGTVEQCYSTANVNGSLAGQIGGLVGTNLDGNILNSYASGPVSGQSVVGGLVGICSDTNVIKCYSTGLVTAATSNKGGLIGENVDGSSPVIGSFWDTQTSGLATSDGGTGKTTAEMKTLSTFTGAGWDFAGQADVGIWYIKAGDYPRLCWEAGIKYGGGTGEPNNPYLIYTAAQMNRIGLDTNDWSKCFKLMADIDLSAYTGQSYNIIGNGPTPDYKPFSGVFDGNYHSISGFTYSASSNKNYVGIFGYISDAAVKNIRLISPNITDPGHDDMRYVGALAGYNSGGDISGCSVGGGIVEGEQYIGGLAGLVSSPISECSSSASVSGGSIVGGLIGTGSSFGSLSTEDSYAQGPVSGSQYIGGFIGNSSDMVLKNCYSTGPVSGDNNVGGFSGYNSNQFFIGNNAAGCFWDTESSGQLTSATGVGKTTAQMQTMSTFLDAGWDFTGELDNGPSDDWAMPSSDGYPVMWYQLDPLPALPPFAGGTGTAEAPYLIETAQHLNSIGHNPRLMDKHFKLISNIDMAGINYYMIAHKPYVFSGVFDGDGHTISNISIQDAEYDTTSCGFIGGIYGNQAYIQNLTLEEPNVFAPWGISVGSLTGENESGNIINCRAFEVSVIGMSRVGGLVGGNYWYGKISGCSATGNVSENNFLGILFSPVGGLVGEHTYWAKTENSSAKCNVSGDDCVGGLIGTVSIYSIISNCYSQGIVTGTENFIGGLIGRMMGYNYIDYCYSRSETNGPLDPNRGGFVGAVNPGRGYYTACFWDSSVNPDINGIGGASDANISGLPTDQMQMRNTYINAGWDFVGETVNGPNDIWKIEESLDYPRFAWERDYWQDIDVELVFSSQWIYQNLPNQTNSKITAQQGMVNDPRGNSGYTYSWEMDLPGDVTVAPVTVSGGDWNNNFWAFAAPSCNVPAGLSDSGKTFKVRIWIIGNDYGNYGTAEKEFAIALLGDINNDGTVNITDRSIANMFMRTGAAGSFTLKDCDLNCDGTVNITDRSIANSIMRGALGTNYVSSPCALR